MENATAILQKKLGSMFKELTEVMDKKNIIYYIVGGTLLGAVRHKGFIPWDDDIDISLPRPVYDDFIKNGNTWLPSYYKIESLHNNPEFPYFFAKIYDTRTTLVENFTQPFTRGIYIDVFPLDGISDEPQVQIKNVKKVRFYVKVYRRIFTTKARSPKFFNRMAHYMISPIAKVLYSKNSLFKKIYVIQTKIPWEKAIYTVNYFGAWKEKEIQPKAWYQERSEYEFEGFKVWGPKEYDKVLGKLYGNYMQLPPKEKQMSHHLIKYLNLSLPYDEYKSN